MDFTLLLGLFLCVLGSQDLVLGKYAKKSDISLYNTKRLARAGNVKFYYYTRQTQANPELLQINSLSRSLKNKPIKLVIHGWMGSDEKIFAKSLREGLLANQDINVVIVDWSEAGSKSWLYPHARQKVPQVAAVVADFLNNLNRQLGVRLESVHIVGHSLGAHVAGIAGYLVKTGRIGRITGLDPAGPSFSENKPNERLSPSSALFVDVIHTCGNYLGMNGPMGHADFYPNGGFFIQPGCAVDVNGSCSHRRSYFFYLESLANKRAFPAVPCAGWKEFKDNKRSCNMGRTAFMGEGLSTSTRGVYYLTTNGNAPYGLGRV